MEEFPLNNRPKFLRTNQQIPHFSHVEEAIDSTNNTTLVQLSAERGKKVVSESFEGASETGGMGEGEANLAK
jgi:hypothetical protein